MNRPCLSCGTLTTRVTRCAACQKAWEAERAHRRGGIYKGNWQATSREARRLAPWCHCTGCARCTLAPAGTGCISMDLCLDHEHGQVECRACNASHRRNPGEVS